MKKVILLILVILIFPSQTTKPFVSLQLHGNATTAYYHTYIEVGNPPQKQAVIADTGSSLLVLYCAGCKDDVCQQAQLPLYKPGPNSQPIMCDTQDLQCSNFCGPTQRLQPCLYRQFYDGMNVIAKGEYLQDRLQLYTESKLLNQTFDGRLICTTTFKKSDNLKTEYNGILGLGPNSRTNVIYRWFDGRGLQVPKVFSICLAENGGTLELGANPQTQGWQNGIQSSFRSLQYNLNIRGIKLGNLSLMSEAQLFTYKVLVDSGSPYIALPSSQYQKAIEEISSICKQNKHVCQSQNKENTCYTFQNLSPSQNAYEQIDQLFPTFVVDINGMAIFTPPSLYSEKYLSGKHGTTICLNIQPISEKKQLVILGTPWMRKQKFTFDLDQRKITIFPGADCTYQPQPIQYQTDTPGTTIVLSYFILFLLFISLVWGRKLVKRLSEFRERMTRRNVEFVEELEQRSEAISTN